MRWKAFIHWVKSEWERAMAESKGSAEVVMTIVTILITIMFGAILFYFTGSVGYDIAGTMTNATLKNKTYGFLSNLTNIGGSLLYFTVLIALAMVFSVLLIAFKIKGRGGEGV